VANQCGREEGVAVDPDLAIIADAADLHANLVRVADDHHLEHVVPAGMGIQYDAGSPLELMDVPVAGRHPLQVGFEHAIGHGRLQPDGAWCRQDVPHQVELFLRHGLVPGLYRFTHGVTLLSVLGWNRS